MKPPAHLMTALEVEATELVTGYAKRAGVAARQRGLPRAVPEGVPSNEVQHTAFLSGWDEEDARQLGAFRHLGGEA
jgi:hypothetical protein